MIRQTMLLLLAVAATPALAQTGTFIDRRQPTDLRVVTYNVMWDHNFPDVDAEGAEKFARVAKALDADVWCIQEIRDKRAPVAAALMNKVAPKTDKSSWHAYKGYTNLILSKYPLLQTGDRTNPPGQRELAYALIDLPDDRFGADLFVMNNHWKCCGGLKNDPKRQQQADAIMNWIRVSREPGGSLTIPRNTPIVLCGDLNLVGSPEPFDTLVEGDIRDEGRYGADFGPDWDHTSLRDACPPQNASTPQYYTWRNDGGEYEPGRLDFVVYTDSVMVEVHRFVLNTTSLDEKTLSKTGLQKFDVCHDNVGAHFDHMPVVVDFRLKAPLRPAGNVKPMDVTNTPPKPPIEQPRMPGDGTTPAS